MAQSVGGGMVHTAAATVALECWRWAWTNRPWAGVISAWASMSLPMHDVSDGGMLLLPELLPLAAASKGLEAAARVAAALAEGVVQTNRVRGKRAQSVPAATSRVASYVEGPPELRMVLMSLGGSPPGRGKSVEACASVLAAPGPDELTAAVACLMRLSSGTTAFGGKAQRRL